MVKKGISLFLGIILLATCIGIVPVKADDGDLDEILSYLIYVNPREDGTLDMEFKITWKVLDDTTEGPLEWVKIGIPNKFVNEITALSENISDIQYNGDGGSYVRIEFKEAVYAEETITFSFQIHQTHMYQISGKKCTYVYTPGWFDEIKVDNISIFWKAENVSDSDAHFIQDGYLIWNGGLEKGEKFTVTIAYPVNVFDLNYNEQYREWNESEEEVGTAVIAVIIGVLILVLLFWGIYRLSYSIHSGFGPKGHRGGRTGIRGGGGGCVRSCACACACACAGGGRAGCSRKDFYSAKKIRFAKKEEGL